MQTCFHTLHWQGATLPCTECRKHTNTLRSLCMRLCILKRVHTRTYVYQKLYSICNLYTTRCHTKEGIIKSELTELNVHLDLLLHCPEHDKNTSSVGHFFIITHHYNTGYKANQGSIQCVPSSEASSVVYFVS